MEIFLSSRRAHQTSLIVSAAAPKVARCVLDDGRRSQERCTVDTTIIALFKTQSWRRVAGWNDVSEARIAAYLLASGLSRGRAQGTLARSFPMLHGTMSHDYIHTDTHAMFDVLATYLRGAFLTTVG